MKFSIFITIFVFIGCKNRTPEEKSLENCEAYIREKENITAELKKSHVGKVKDSKLDTYPYENAAYDVFLEFDTENKYKKYGDCLCDEDGNVIPRDIELEKRLEREAEEEIEEE